MLLLARIMWSQWLLLALSLCAVQAATTRRTTTPRSATTTTNRHQHVHHWPPLVAPPYSPLPDLPVEIRLIDGYDQRTSDGEYEFRYELSNGDTRYERTYWLPVGKGRVLARRGFYSVPLPNSKYSTVYYRADHQGYHVESNTLSEKQPLLPRSLDVAPLDTAGGAAEATKRNSISVPERNDSEQQKEEQLAQSAMEPNADGVDDDDDVVANGNGNGNGNGNVNRNRVRYPSKVKVQTELEQAIVNKTKDFENILASQVGSEITQEQLHADDNDDDGDGDGDMLAHDDDSRLH